MKIQIEDMADIGRGAAFLGTGGGGDPHIGRLLCEQTLREFGSPKLIALDQLDPEANVYTVGMMGAPTVMIEKLCAGDDAALAVANWKNTGVCPPTRSCPSKSGG